MQDLCEPLLTSEILSRAVAADRWLLQFVCKRFRKVVGPTSLRDPRRRRVLDDVLDHAVSNGGLATVRWFLFRKKESCVWATAAAKAASKGDLEMVRLVVERGSARGALLAALTEGHVHVAEYIHRRHTLINCWEEMLLASARSGSRAALEWAVSKKVDDNLPRMWGDVFVNAWKTGDVESVEFLCDLFGRPTVSGMLSTRSDLFGHVTMSVPVLRFLRSEFGYEMRAKDMLHMICCYAPSDSNKEPLLDYVVEIHGLEALTRSEAARDVDVHAFLVRKGLIPRADLAAANNVQTVDQFKTLADLRPDPKEWIAELGPEALKRLLEKKSLLLQPSLASFFGKGLLPPGGFCITTPSSEDFEALCAMGGRCTSYTLWEVVCASEDVRHARAVWARMDADERVEFRFAKRSYHCYVRDGPDLEFMEFVASELKAVKRLRSSHFTYRRQRSRLTAPLARFLLENRIMTPALLLDEAVACGHADVAEMVSRAIMAPCARIHGRGD